MTPQAIDAEHITNDTTHIRFADGTEGDVDLQKELDREVSEPFKDPAYFQTFEVHPDLHTITWPNGADFAPEFLYEKVKVPA